MKISYLILALFCLIPFAYGKDKLSAEKEFLHNASIKLYKRLFGKKDLKICKRYFKKASEENRIKFLVILARNARVMEKRPIDCLFLLGPELLDIKKVQSWKRENDAKQKTALSKWKKDCTLAKLEKRDLPGKPTGLFVKFSPPDEWKIENSNAICAIEVARAHIDLGRYRTAIAIIDKLGKNFENEIRVCSAECGGDLMIKTRMYDKGISLYELALGVLKSLSSEGQGLNEEQKIIELRIRKSLAEAKRLRDIDLYGLGFVLYRDAEGKRRKENAFSEAIIIYEDIQKKFPDSVYAEAAAAYTIKCLFHMNTKNGIRKSKKSIVAHQKLVKTFLEIVKTANKSRVPDPILDEIEKDIAKIELKIKRLQNVPVGKKALLTALKKADSFISSNEYGLYRGEILVLLAEYAFLCQLDPALSAERYTHAWEWMNKVKKTDADLKSFDVPVKAKSVSTPPGAESYFDFWGKSVKNEPVIGAIVNRRTCYWYLSDLKEHCALAAGFLHFWRGNKEKAIKCYQMVLKLDEKTKRQHDVGEWNNVKRLKLGAELGFLFAEPDELEWFKKRKRFAVLVGDFYYCTERFNQAADIYNRLLAKQLGNVTTKQKDFLHYAIGNCKYHQLNRKGAYLEWEKVLKTRQNTLLEDKTQYVMAKVGRLVQEEKIWKKSLLLAKDLAYSGRDNENVYRAWLLYAKMLVYLGHKEKSFNMYQNLPKNASPKFEKMAEFWHGFYKKKFKSMKENPDKDFKG